MTSGWEYRDHIESEADTQDWYWFYMAEPQSIEVWLTGICAGCDYNLTLANEAFTWAQSSGNLGNLPEHIGPTEIRPAGKYYIRVNRADGWSTTQPYVLRAAFGP